MCEGEDLQDDSSPSYGVWGGDSGGDYSSVVKRLEGAEVDTCSWA